MNEKLIERIIQSNKIKYGNENDNEIRIIICTLKPETKGTVTTATKNKELQANVTRKKPKIPQ